MRKLTHEEFLERVVEWHGAEKYTVLGEYENSKKPILLRHNECGTEWMIAPGNIKKLKGCSKCHGKLISEARSKTHTEFKVEVENTGEYKLLSKYQDSKNKVSIKHTSCGHVFKMVPSKFSFGQRCPKCMRPNHARTNDHFVRQVYELVGTEYEPLEEFKGVENKIIMLHNNCGHEYHVSPHKFLNGGRRCPKCANNILKDTETYSREVTELTDGEYKLMGEYSGNREYVKMLHVSCGHNWLIKPYNFTSGKRCPKCKQSQGERKVEEYLKSIKVNYESEFRIDECKIELPLPFDFAIVKECGSLVLIEYQGEQHYKAMEFFGGEEAFKKQIQRDAFKRDFCKRNKIPLIEIPYTIKNIDEYLDKKLSAYL